MHLIASIIFSAFFINSPENKDSLKVTSSTEIVFDKEINKIAEEAAALEGAKLEYQTDINSLQCLKVTFESAILFDFNKSTLNNAAKETLTRISEIIIRNPAIGIAITGHTDNIGSLEYNQQLSETRAKAVADFLLSKGVPPSQLKEIAGRNFSEPVADNSTTIGRSANRNAAVSINLPLTTNDSLALKGQNLKTKAIPPSLKKMLESIVSQKRSRFNEIEIDGLLVDDTKTKAGKDFYDFFYGKWNPPNNAKDYTITISEKPFRLTSTIITVSINENNVYQSFLQPRLDIIEAIAEDALFYTQGYLASYAEIMKQLNGEDMSGSGIF
jgi:curli production assembly/transport component CsgE